jgi:hypothetical protein
MKTLADALLKLCYHSSELAQDVGRQAKRALFKSVLNCCCTSPVTLSVASVPCQHSGCTFLDYKVGTRSEPCGYHVWKESCTLGNFLVNLGNFMYLLSRSWGLSGGWGQGRHTRVGHVRSHGSVLVNIYILTVQCIYPMFIRRCTLVGGSSDS